MRNSFNDQGRQKGMVSSAVVPKGPYRWHMYRVPLLPGSLPDVIKQQHCWLLISKKALRCVAPLRCIADLGPGVW